MAHFGSHFIIVFALSHRASGSIGAFALVTGRQTTVYKKDNLSATPSLISLMVSVDVKHHVYLLTATLHKTVIKKGASQHTRIILIRAFKTMKGR